MDETTISDALKATIELGVKLSGMCQLILEEMTKMSSRLTSLENRVNDLNHQLINDEEVTCSCDKHDVRRRRIGEKTLDT
jgi:hypothetical protein